MVKSLAGKIKNSGAQKVEALYRDTTKKGSTKAVSGKDLRRGRK